VRHAAHLAGKWGLLGAPLGRNVLRMATQSLYRKYRPQRFRDLVGQEHVTRALQNAVREGTFGQGYLFSGPRGTGKTTTARILAKALNCTGPDGGGLPADGEPCGVCPSCVEITGGSSMDVIEIDAASTRSIDDMRDLLRRVALVGGAGRHKVYIVDEVHQLTRDASSALLKTLEEPPPHVVFVLATTDPHKVLDTIRSRTQHYEFSLLPIEQLTALLADILRQEGVEADEESLRLVARRGAGSARDAESLLDQALAYGGGRIDAAAVRALFEATPFDRRAAVLDAIAAEDAAGALVGVGDVLATGVDARQLADDLLRQLRDVFVVSASRGAAHVDASEEELARLRALGEAMGAGAVQRSLEVLGQAVSDMARAPDSRLLVEVAVVRLARRELGTPVEVLADRVERLERALAALQGGAPLPPAAVPPPAAPAGGDAGDRGPSAVARPTLPPRPVEAPVEATADPPEAVAIAPAADAPAEDVPAGPPPGEGAAAGVADVRRTLGAFKRSPDGSVRAAPARAAEPTAPPAPVARDPAPAPVATDEPPVAAEPPPVPAAPVPAAPASAPSAPAAGAVRSPVLDEVVLRWPDVLDELAGRVKPAAREAQPAEFDGGVLTLVLPTIHARHLPMVEAAEEHLTSLLAERVPQVTAIRVLVDDRLAIDHAPLAAAPVADPAPPAPPAPEPSPEPAVAAAAPVVAPPVESAPEPSPEPSPEPEVEVTADVEASVEPAPAPTATSLRTTMPKRGASVDRAEPTVEAVTETEAVPDDDETTIDLAELVDAPRDSAEVDSASQLIRLFDAEIIEEIERDRP
jgi:DNA polymerase III subunit gamma/tau